ncbi:MAG: 1-(5-phosphoribosyl)-5-[(5-phosphoribosylamino)methylideneamino] imidazole-4-carboxamide isomerase, partial [Prevotellaceae bacterium]|nr:1-(5-phosphoribosyl)-5-[(5-phosphoribosylamino)methylideneamino] imidazole-4-carboxamide isomerase [Prevotellaceae bacterium]
LHVVDLVGAAANHIVNHRSLEHIASRTSLQIDFGGGIKTSEDLLTAFDCGAEMVTVGSIAVRNPELVVSWLRHYGAAKIILGADVKDGRIAINGWREESQQELLPFLRYYTEQGVEKVICTDISRDGMLQGTAIELYKQILAAQPDLFLIASGGVSNIDDIRALDEAGIPAVIFGKAFYEGRITWKELYAYL